MPTENHKKFTEKTRDLTNTLKDEAKKNGHDLKVEEYGSMFSIKFSRQKDLQKFYKNMFSNGVFLAPSEYEANFMSFAHSEADIRKTKTAIGNAMRFKQDEGDLCKKG